MTIAANVVVALVALLHVYILILEMFLWDKPRGMRAFGLTAPPRPTDAFSLFKPCLRQSDSSYSPLAGGGRVTQVPPNQSLKLTRYGMQRKLGLR